MFDPSTLTDESLLRRVASGDRRAFEILYDRQASATYGLILRIVRDRTVADDVLQEAFWQVWKRAGEYRGEGQVAAWIFRIARNRSLDELRRRQRVDAHTTTGLDDWEAGEAPAQSGESRTSNPLLRQLAASRVTTGDAAAEFSHEQSRRHVHEALQTIPAEQRLCLELAYFEGMSQQQIAERANLPLGTVKTRMRMGLAKLEHILRAQGYRQEDLLL